MHTIKKNNSIMFRPDHSAPLFHQSFKTEDNSPLTSISTHLCAESGKRFVNWDDITIAFKSINYLQDRSEERLLFMINEKAELYKPLRIEHDPDQEYTVTYIESQGQSDNYRDQGSALFPPSVILSPPLERLATTTTYLFDRLKLTPKAARSTFLQLVANTRYYHGLLVNEIQCLDEAAFEAQFGENDRTLVIGHVRSLEESVPLWDRRNVCFNMFYGGHSRWDYATSKLFIVLPTDLNALDGHDPSTHRFRLYFLCDNSMDAVTQKGTSQHVHLSKHPGYNLKRPQEFFRIYGDYVLRMLQLVKLGYSDNTYHIPSLATKNILWKDESPTGTTLSKQNITSLVDMAIVYIEHSSPCEWIVEPGMTRNQSAAIRDFLEVQPGDDAEGNLNRHIDSNQCVSWLCQMHKEQYFDWKLLRDLKKYLRGKQGHLDMQQATLRVELKSYIEAVKFQRRIADSRHPFNLSITLNWRATRSEIENICKNVAQLKTVTLELHGITEDIYPQGYAHYTRDIFADKVLQETGLQLVTLFNYPVPEEQRIYLGQCSLQSKFSLSGSSRSWVELRTDLGKFAKLVSGAQAVSDCKAAAMELQSVQKKHDLSSTTLVTVHGENWAAVFDLEEGAVIEAYSYDAACPKAIRSSGSLRKLTVDLRELEFDKEFFQIVNANTGLQHLNVSYESKTVFFYIENMVNSWRESSIPYCLTLIDRLEDTQGRIVAKMRIEKRDSDGPPSNQRDGQGAPTAVIQFLHWDEDQASALFDYQAVFLDMATQQHSFALVLFTVDTSRLSHDGLLAVRNVLRRSPLQHLSLICSTLDPTLHESIKHVLEAVPWNTLKSLVLSGNNSDVLMNLWPAPKEPRLLSLQVFGPGSVPQELSHSSTLFIHQLVNESPLERLDLQGVQLQEARDWTVIVDAVDPEYLKKLGLCKNSFRQLQSNSNAVDLFDSRFNRGIGTMAKSPHAKHQTLEVVLPQRPRNSWSKARGLGLRTQESASQMTTAASEISEESGTQTPVSTSDMSDETGARTPASMSEVSDESGVQTPHSTPEMVSNADTRMSFPGPSRAQNITHGLPASQHGSQKIVGLSDKSQRVYSSAAPGSTGRPQKSSRDTAAQDHSAVRQGTQGVVVPRPPTNRSGQYIAAPAPPQIFQDIAANDAVMLNQVTKPKDNEQPGEQPQKASWWKRCRCW
ncbi:MAG: hypothetical protein BYD32DRAFT_422011 [Podila humilis]|nr:MAG: hypothetical protein BYD32DRAFT_422011 [Podila humilis]